MFRHVVWWSLLLLSIWASIQSALSVSSQKALLQKLFTDSGYNSDVRPVTHANGSVSVSIDLSLEQIIDLSEPDQILICKIWMKMIWNDVNLQWDPGDFDGMTNMTIRADEIWRPDILLFENVDQGFSGWPVDQVRVDSDGTVYWAFPVVTSTSCDVDVASFPFDAQACPLRFGSWLHDRSMIKLDRNKTAGSLVLKPNAEWEVASFKPIFKVKKFGSSYFDEATFILAMERKWSFYFFNLLFPCFLLALLATLSFYVPAESGDKISFGVTVLLALSVFLLMIAEKMPVSEKVPLVAWYVIVTLVLLSLSLLLGSIVVNLSICTADTTPVPAWVRRLVLRYMSQVLFMGDLSGSLTVKQEQEADEPGKKPLDDSTMRIIRASAGEPGEYPEGPDRMKGKPGMSSLMMEELVRDVRNIVSHLEDEREGEALENDWKRVARVMDKFFMTLYLLTTLFIILATCMDGVIGWSTRLDQQKQELEDKV
ncbi:neuronal acetylcholine receptor subunit alpha-10-like isoform X2 [Branchiostoma lanceolatum]|uniref:neuronal acetylcholine receptor subunit alpha-10-like isoform X2 n=1 Tax=Branchiostoma lanceolatum TaxID=7740 RepID=UPI003453EAD4